MKITAFIMKVNAKFMKVTAQSTDLTNFFKRIRGW